MFGLQQPGDSVDKNPGFAAACAGEHKQTLGRACYRIPLLLI
jgi:hypothetical protein